MLGFTLSVRMHSFRMAAALGLLRGTTLPDRHSGQASCQHDGSPPLCALCCWVLGLI
jgi:hypothetical protein